MFVCNQLATLSLCSDCTFCAIITKHLIWYMFQIPTRLGNNFPSFENLFRKIAFTTSIQKLRSRQRLIAFTFANMIQYPHTLKNNIYHSTWTTTFFSFGYQSCTWPRSDPFCWQNLCSRCNSRIDLVVFLE